jgi:2-polyprenyl-3-methyl-5-hydroxy-6-metoxy-1,4-benzoquinol methylase
VHLTEYTSERVSFDQYQATVEDQLIFLLHEKTYRLAADLVRDKHVLDFGCGDGYGTHILAQWSKNTTGVDVDGPAVALARDKYPYPGLSYEQIKAGSRLTLPFKSESFDVVVSFQVIEHVDSVKDYLGEIHRVIRKGGRFICSTPNAQSRLLPFQNPWNKHHVREFTPLQLTRSVEPYFEIEHTFGLTYTPQWLEVERTRVTRNKWLLWPLTNKLVPTVLRRHLLRAVWKIAVGRKERTPRAGVRTPGIEDVLVTADNIAACPSLLLVCRKTD